MSSFSTLLCAIIAINASPLPPIQDQCKPVNTTEPPQCPQTIGPPCPPCYTNDATDYETGDPISFSVNEQQEIGTFMSWYIDWWYNNYPPPNTSNGFDIWEGSAGRGEIFLRLYNYENMNKSYINTASDYIDHAISILPSKQQQTSWASGFNGVWSLKAIIETINGNDNEKDKYLNDLVDWFNDIDAAIQSGASKTPKYGLDMTSFSLNDGLSGALYNALLLNEYFNANIIAIDVITNLTYFILDDGIKVAESRKHEYLEWEHPYVNDCYTYGAGSGSGGVIKMIYTAYQQYPDALKSLFDMNGKYYKWLKGTIDFYVSIQLSDDNMPTQTGGNCPNMYGTDDDARVQWCHGAPSFMNVFVESALLFAQYNSTAADIYLNSGMRCSNATWDRGLLVKGTMFCHGVGGNVYMFWELFELLGKVQQRSIMDGNAFEHVDLTFLQNQSAYRAKQFILWTLDWSNVLQTRIYDSDEAFAMHQGNFALPMLYIQAIQDGWPQSQKVCTPSWNLCV